MPAGTPAAVVQRVNEEVSKALQIPAIADRFNALSFFPQGGNPAELRNLIAHDSEKWRKLIQSAGIRAD